MRITVYDTEIEKAILAKKDPVLPNIEYCAGWRDFQNMGISVATAYDYNKDQYRVFCKDNLPDFKVLVDDSDLIVGFNNNQFDDNLMAFNHVVIDPAKTYDILQEVWEAAGVGKVDKRNPFDFRAHAGYGLDAIAEVNLGYRKTGEGGGMAPVNWQRGKYGIVIDYGLNDTWLTKGLFDLIIDKGALVCPKTGKKLQMRNPLE